MHARRSIIGFLAVAIAMGGATGTALADPVTTDPTPMTITSGHGPVDVTVLNTYGDGYSFTVPAGGRSDVPTEAGGYSRIVISENGVTIGERALLNPDLQTYCDVRPATEDPRLSCGIIA
ncbi:MULTISPECIES: hypothetical protein [unclassified Pseudonocardia]|uniref:hypothetical protein n=1 Tax=unclassified Pseudonocardia TaxID=2619320 RepID=UPI0001FFE0DB|nr:MULTISPECIES: hypothetical protein [unclassified Pseudonocardia]ALE75358.1 hypothetical protein FRP1_25090 [Pseudonocardia sp. EC080625-04]ALL74718.1 hypothetical protein AD006_04270 [Pseudonocardia sp. EC080610-09]ALL81741.1 hypothetical protein AD017_12090 [Pseudonocardia sp. EC080619-01]OLM15948.1 hypothetical protein Ae707Ps1_0206c [Pseudonocardia sp. Ae707_Ps1]